MNIRNLSIIMLALLAFEASAMAMNQFRAIQSPQNVLSRTTPSPHNTRGKKRKLDQEEESDTAKKLRIELEATKQKLQEAEQTADLSKQVITQAIHDKIEQLALKNDMVAAQQQTNDLAQKLAQAEQTIADQQQEIIALNKEKEIVDESALRTIGDAAAAFSAQLAIKNDEIDQLKEQLDSLKAQKELMDGIKKDSLDHMYS